MMANDDKGVLQVNKAIHLCQEISSNAKKILSRKGEADPQELNTLFTEASVLMVNLKQANREATLEADRIRAETNKAKTRLDQINVQYQALRYEEQFYRREIEACQYYVVAHPDLQVFDETEYAQSTDTEEKRNERDVHQLNINRYNFEMQERKRLRDEVAQQLSKKKAMIDSNFQKRAFLNSIASKLQTVSTSAAPVKQAFAMSSVVDDYKQNSLARQLASPLYNLFYSVSMCKASFGYNFKIDAVSLADITPSVQTTTVTGDSSQIKQENISNEELLTPHLFAVVLELDPLNVNKWTSVRFEYLPRLNIIVVHTDETNMLVNLFSNDTGIESPNPATALLMKTKFDWETESTKRPYKWAQWLGGLDFLAPLFDRSETDVHQNIRLHFDAVYKALHKRIATYQKLSQQLDSFTKLMIPDSGTSPAVQALESWSSVTRSEWKQFLEIEAAAPVGDSEEGEVADTAPIVIDLQIDTTPGIRYFNVKFKSTVSSMKVEAFVELPPEYPTKPSVVKIKTNSPNINSVARTLFKTIESKINSIAAVDDHLLTHQLHQLYEIQVRNK
eukprot:TRINITY_DN10363_c0_g1_i1.p1 TRINITY_DN10363_c0_g1~~TRINITY_DN10363_c0_g1_i1.p1  ORF type:complete len:562 (-),score=158.50 TRINITY_DN10363_c0_g1_i1:62-1747(-)